MSVIVKGMKMPAECEYCGFCRYYYGNGNVWCNATNKLLKQKWVHPEWTHLDVKIPDWCPLVEIPPKHGRLFDEAEVKKVIEEVHDDVDKWGAIALLEWAIEKRWCVEAEGEE